MAIRIKFDPECFKSGNTGGGQSVDLQPVLDRLTALENKTDNDTLYDDTALKERVKALEAKEDKDTVYDDSALTARVTTLESKVDNDKQPLTLTGNELSISNGNSVDLTVYRGSFTDRTKVMEGEHDALISPRVTLTYSSSTGVGIFKIDFKVTSKVNWRDVIATLPPEAPVPVELVESQVWIGNNNTSVWIDKGSRNVQIFGVSNPEMFNKRIILSIPGIFKKA